MKATIILSITLTLIGCSATGFQLPLPGTTTPSSAEGVELVGRMSLATFELGASQVLLAESFGLREDAGELSAELANLQADSAFDATQFERFVTVSNRTQALIDEKMAAKTSLSQQQRQMFAHGALRYAIALYHTREAYQQIETLAGATKARSGMLFGAGGGGVKSLWERPADVLVVAGDGVLLASAVSVGMQLLPAHAQTLGLMLSFMETGGVPLPQDFRHVLTNSYEDAAATACEAGVGQNCLWVRVFPEDARIVLPDIKPRYSDGIVLNAGPNRIIVKKPGYETRVVTADLSDGNQRVTIALQPAS